MGDLFWSRSDKFFPRRFGLSGAVLLALLFLPAVVCGQGSSTLELTGGNVGLTFASPVPGQDFSDVIDDTSCDLEWSNGPGTFMITVATNNSSPTASLVFHALNVTKGTSSGDVHLSTTSMNFVTAIPQGMGNCDLEYTASVSLTDGAGTDVHTVTYTMQSASYGKRQM